MKKIILLFVLFLPILVQAQRFQGGLLGGLNATQVRGDAFTGYNKAGVLAGAFVSTELSENFFWQMEFKYSQKGSRKNPNHEKQDFDKYIMRLGFMELPVLIGYHADERIDILAGFSVGWLAHAKEFDIQGEFPREDQVSFKEYEFAGFAGLRYNLSAHFAADLRIGYSLIPIRDMVGDSPYWFTGGQFNNVLSTALYYRFK